MSEKLDSLTILTERFGVTKADIDFFQKKGKPLSEVSAELEALSGTIDSARVIGPAKSSNGFIIEISDSDKKEFISYYLKSSQHLKLAAVIPAAGAASRQFQLLKTILGSDLLKDKNSYKEIKEAVSKRINDSESSDQISATEQAELKALKEVQSDIERFWEFGIKQKAFAFCEDLSATLKRDNLNYDSLVQQGDLKTIASYIIEPHGLNYAFLPKALMRWHKYETESGTECRLAIEEHIRQAIRLFDGRDSCRVHFIISEEHESHFQQRLGQILESSRMSEYLAEYSLSSDSLKISYDFQSPATDSVALDISTEKIARTPEGLPLLRKSGHGALLPNISNIEADGFWLQNIDNILYENSDIIKSVQEYKMLMAGLAFKKQEEIFSWRKKLEQSIADKNEEAVIEELVAFIQGNLCMSINLNSKEPAKIAEDLLEILSRPLVIAGYVPLEPGQAGGGPFVIEETTKNLTLKKVNTVEGSEFAGGQNNPHFQNGQYFNPVNMFILRNNMHGARIDLSSCVDPSRCFTSSKTDSQGKAINAYERPGLWNGSLAKALQISIAVPAITFGAVKNCAGKESLLAKLHQPE